MFDVAIAGGGIAGSALAILLGRQGLSVGLFERDTFPREKACGEGLMPGGVAVLRRIGLADAVGGAPFYGVRFHFGQMVAEGHFPPLNRLPAMGRGQRRRHLDRALFDAAAATPGVRAQTGSRVDAPVSKNGRVVGFSVEGQPQHARLVVAADGPHSCIARSLGLLAENPTRSRRFGLRVHFRLAAGQSQLPWVEVFAAPGHELYVTPLPGREIVVVALARATALGGSPERVFRRWCHGQPPLASLLDGAEQTSDLLGASPLSRWTRAGFVPGLALLGDAAGSTDPITGGGMAQALIAAELLARYIASHFAADGNGGTAWLSKFDRERKALLRNYRIVTRMMLWLADRPLLARSAVHSLSSFPVLFSQLIGTCAGVPNVSGDSSTA